MAKQGDIVAVWTERGHAHMAVRVTEGNENVEYIGSVPLTDAFRALTRAQQKAALVAAVKAVRDAQVNERVVLADISGTVTI